MTTSRLNSVITAGHFKRAVQCTLLVVILLLGAVVTHASSPQIVIPITSEADLREAIGTANQNPQNFYRLELGNRTLDLTDLGGLGSALPDLSGRIQIANGTLRGGGQTSDYRLIEVINGGLFTSIQVTFSDFRSSGNGGCIAIGGRGLVFTAGGKFLRCTAAGDGGAIFSQGGTVRIDESDFELNQGARGGAIATFGIEELDVDSARFITNSSAEGGAIYSENETLIFGSRFSGNSSTGLGGAISTTADSVTLVSNQFVGNSAVVFGCGVNLSQGPQGRASIGSNQFEGSGCDNAQIEQPFAVLDFIANTSVVFDDTRQIDSTGETNLVGNLLVGANPPNASKSAKLLCADFGSGAFNSLGGNIATDSSCALSAPTDLITQSPGLNAPDADGIRSLSANSPAIDRGAAQLVQLGDAALLPCGYRDIRGLGRPQDGNGDGVFDCDAGAWELQGGPDIGSAQSAALFDDTRNGEGTLLEMIGANLAVISVFTYGVDGGLAWFSGLGNVVGNSVVVDDLNATSGGRFGAAFDEDAIVSSRVGGFSLVFPDCEAGANPGRQMFQTAPGSGYEDLLVKAQRVTTVVPCAGPPGPNAGLSGSYFAVGRSGEGIALQFQPDGSVVLVFYTYTPDGQPFWTIASGATITGNVVTAPMIYAVGTTQFGSSFDADQINFAPWGTITLTFIDCLNVTLAWTSTVPGYGSGSYDYSRLTAPAGTTCAL